ncbi:MAG TPA: hypothetical protein VFI13_08375, partial [Gemmatimonadales bacterium]|nr:hypothetical protein [Gemmatimonadales bacterium]
MSVGRRLSALLTTLLLAGCAAHRPPLATIERIPGSTTYDGGPSDSSRTIHKLAAGGTTAGT